MTKEEKSQVVDNLTKEINETSHLYITDTLGLSASETSKLRGECYKKDVKLIVAKNTLIKRAIEKSDKDLSELLKVLEGTTSLMFSETGNAPAKIIKNFRGKDDEKPAIKGAYVEQDFYFGDDQIDNLVSVKSKEELVADIIAILQAPTVNLLSALQSGGSTLTGVLKTLEEKNKI